MAVGPETVTSPLHPVAGLRLATVSVGVKTPGRRDLVVMELAPGSHVAGVFTRNAFCAAPVTLCREHLVRTSPRWLITNTGNANAGTGEDGRLDALTICRALAEQTGSDVTEVLPFSTGVIGQRLPVDKITAALPEALAGLREDGWLDAAHGIMTTDTRPKAWSDRFLADGAEITITGLSKGAGMIKPNMATMLAYVATDASVAPALLQQLVSELNEYSFNRITVDGDTSTNDSLVLVATGQGAAHFESGNEAGFAAFRARLEACFVYLAQAIIRDGEGATKFVEVRVEGGATADEARQVAFTVAESPLIKTALFASDPNWGRILAAIGRSGLANLDVERVSVFINDILIAERGAVSAGYTEAQGQAAMEPEDIVIRIDLGRGDHCDRVWTTDLSYDYVRINAEYRT